MKMCVQMLAAISLAVMSPAFAHHSYAMFDMTRRELVMGTVAKVEWTNPHIFIWVYVHKKTQDGYDLYAFEGGGPNMLMRTGWTKTSLKVGEKITVEYFPLKSGGNGGSFVKAIHADGSTSMGDGPALNSPPGNQGKPANRDDNSP